LYPALRALGAAAQGHIEILAAQFLDSCRELRAAAQFPADIRQSIDLARMDGDAVVAFVQVAICAAPFPASPNT
jgi:hypothetical protein